MWDIYDLEEPPILIRTTNERGFRCGEWARIVGLRRSGNNEPCYVVEFIDNKRDSWLIADPSGAYEFK